MTKTVYVGNLPYETTEKEVRGLCAPFGGVESVSMITDRETGRFRGFCFVEMEEATAKAAIAGLNGKEVSGRQIKVSLARPRKKGQGRKQRTKKTDNRPLHERTQRGDEIYGGAFPDSGGNRGRRSGRDENRDGSSSDFPHSGGSRRRF